MSEVQEEIWARDINLGLKGNTDSFESLRLQQIHSTGSYQSAKRCEVWTLCIGASNAQKLLVRNCDCYKTEKTDHDFINAALWTKTLKS